MALEFESLDSQSQPISPLTLIPLNRPISLSTSSSLELSSSTLPTTTSSSSSSLPTLNVKFAPLPQLLARKRRSTVPLGMAARGQLIPRRGYRGQNVPPMWTDKGPEEYRTQQEQYRLQQEELAARDARSSAYAAYVAARTEEDEDGIDGWHHQRRKSGEQVDEDDPLQVFGRIVKVAGKTLWKRVSNKDVTAAAATSLKVDPEDSKTTTTKACPPTLGSDPTSNVDDHPEEEGAVWEEEIGDSFPRYASQTDTIVEGRVYSLVRRSSAQPLPGVSNLKRVLKRPSTKKFKVKQGS